MSDEYHMPKRKLDPHTFHILHESPGNVLYRDQDWRRVECVVTNILDGTRTIRYTAFGSEEVISVSYADWTTWCEHPDTQCAGIDYSVMRNANAGVDVEYNEDGDMSYE